MSGVISMQSHQMRAVGCLILTIMFPGSAFAQGFSAHAAVFSLGLLVVGALAVYVVIQIRNSLRSDLDKR
jgi:hypothetical protein